MYGELNIDKNKSRDEFFEPSLFSSPQKPKTFQDSLSHRILRHMHAVLNIDENKN